MHFFVRRPGFAAPLLPAQQTPVHDLGLIGPVPGTTPPELRTSHVGVRDLPDDLLREATQRLRIMALLGAALWTIGPILGHLAGRAMAGGELQWLRLGATDAISAVCMALSLMLYWYTRRERDPRLMLNVSLGYLIFTAFALSLMIHWSPPVGWQEMTMISWVGVVTIMFAAILPNSPRRLLVAGVVAVTMNPAAMLIMESRGMHDIGPLWNAFVMHYPDYVLLGVAGVIAHVVTKLGHQVTRAREMGSYHIGELLGRGGMGEVYTATHRMLARPAAIKLIRPELLSHMDGEARQLAVKRFRREADAAARLQSPHTVQLYDFGVTADGTLYFVMELLDGMDLETLVRTHGPMPPNRVIHLMRQACESLEEAHRFGLVHRDIKPANLHVGRVGLRHDVLKVLDFGLVKAVSGANSDHSLATEAGLTPGTPSYMAPEIALGEPPDGRADIYALGCVAYFLLTGRLVFEADTMLQMVARHLQNDPIPPSERAPNPIPRELDAVVLSCLAKTPEERPATAATLERSLAALPVEPWTEDQAAAWWNGMRDLRPEMVSAPVHEHARA